MDYKSNANFFESEENNISRYSGNCIDKQVKFIGNFGGVSLTKDKVYRAIKESYKYGSRYLIENTDVGIPMWYRAIHFKML